MERASQTTAFCLTWLILTGNWWTLVAWGTLRRSSSLLQHQRACSFAGNYHRNQQIISYKKRRKRRRRRNLNVLNWKLTCKGPEKIQPSKAGIRSLPPRISGQLDWIRIFCCRASLWRVESVTIFSNAKTGDQEGSQSLLSKWKHDSIKGQNKSESNQEYYVTESKIIIFKSLVI